jgi:hypothetical protein
MKKTLLFLFVMLTAFYSNGQGWINNFFDGSSILSPNTDYTQLIDTGNYALNDSLENGDYPYYNTSFYGRKESDSVYYGCTFSNITDSGLTTFNKNRAAFPGIGAEGSPNYGVVHGSDYGADIDLLVGVRGSYPAMIYSLYITNAVITTSSMMNGDSTSKKFGGPDGTDPDWLMLTIYTYQYGNLQDSTNVYLADFRSPDSTQDYILKDWKEVLFNQTICDSLSFRLSSSDTDSVGNMRTPSYFCIDNIATQYIGAVEDRNKLINVSVYPNPAIGLLNIKSEAVLDASLFSINGKQVLYKQDAKQIDISSIIPGIYMLKLEDKKTNSIGSYPILKQ